MERKQEFIKIRISKKDKETLLKLSKKSKESLSSYILHKSLCTTDNSTIALPQQIDYIKFISDIYHEINKSDDEHLKDQVKTICNSYSSNQERTF